MDISIFYNHARMMQDVNEGAKIMNKTATKKECQSYKIGDTVAPSSLCPYNFGNGVIIDAYTDNGYIYYVVAYKRGEKQTQKTFRQKDLI